MVIEMIGRRRPDLQPLVGFMPAIAVFGLWAALVPASGGFDARDWYPAGLALVGVLAAAIIGGGRLLPRGRTAQLALALFGALVAWNLVSIAWSPSPGRAWETGNLLLTYLVAAWILALAPWDPRSAAIALGAWSGAVAVVLAAGLVSALGADDLTRFFGELRWSEPVGYANGLAALGALAGLPALVLAARPGVPAVLQALLLVVATFCFEVALLPQSRGSVIAAAVALPVALLLTPGRWAFALRAAIVFGAIALAADPLLGVYEATRDSQIVSPALEDASRAIAFSCAAAGVTALLLALVSARVQLGERGARWGGIAVAAASVLALGGVALAESERIGDEVSSQWRQLVDPSAETAEREYRRRQRRDDAPRESRLLNASPSERYDYLRVSVDAFKAAPVGGIGGGGFESRYTAERRFPKYSRYPHNLPARVLAENGAVGVLLFVGLIGAILFGLLRGLGGVGSAERALVAASVSAAAYFLAHAEFDWIEAFPVMAAPALGFLVVALVVREPGQGSTTIRGPLPIAATGALAMIAAVALLLPWMSVRYRERAVKSWREDTRAAYRDLDRARSADPLSVSPLLSEGTIAVERRDFARAKAAFQAALEREQHWLAHFELALLAAAQGDRGAAMRQLDEAVKLNPQEAAVSAARAEIRAGRRVDPATFHRRLFDTPLFKIRRLS